MQASLLARLSAHEHTIATLLVRQRVLLDAFGAEMRRTSLTMRASRVGGEFDLMLAEQAEAVARAHRATGEQAGKLEWMLATARDLRAMADGTAR